VNVAAALSENPHSEIPTEVWSEERIAEEERQIAYDKVQIALKHDIELKQIAVKKVELACEKFEHHANLECLAMEMPRRQAIANSPSAIEADNKKRQVAAERLKLEVENQKKKLEHEIAQKRYELLESEKALDNFEVEAIKRSAALSNATERLAIDQPRTSEQVTPSDLQSPAHSTIEARIISNTTERPAIDQPKLPERVAPSESQPPPSRTAEAAVVPKTLEQLKVTVPPPPQTVKYVTNGITNTVRLANEDVKAAAVPKRPEQLTIAESPSSQTVKLVPNAVAKTITPGIEIKQAQVVQVKTADSNFKATAEVPVAPARNKDAPANRNKDADLATPPSRNKDADRAVSPSRNKDADKVTATAKSPQPAVRPMLQETTMSRPVSIEAPVLKPVPFTMDHQNVPNSSDNPLNILNKKPTLNGKVVDGLRHRSSGGENEGDHSPVKMSKTIEYSSPTKAGTTIIESSPARAGRNKPPLSPLVHEMVESQEAFEALSTRIGSFSETSTKLKEEVNNLRKELAARAAMLKDEVSKSQPTDPKEQLKQWWQDAGVQKYASVEIKPHDDKCISMQMPKRLAIDNEAGQ